MNVKKIPQTDSIQELAHFWDTHDVTEFEDQLEEVTDPVFERETAIQIRLQPQQIEAVKEVARLRGINYVDLIQQWILEKVYTA